MSTAIVPALREPGQGSMEEETVRPAALLVLSVLFGWALGLTPAQAEDGYDLWLRYRPIAADRDATAALRSLTLVPLGDSATLRAATAELSRGLEGLSGQHPMIATAITAGAIVYGTGATPAVAALGLPLGDLGREGYIVRSVVIEGHAVTVVAANSDVGVLYGVFALLRHVQTGGAITNLDIVSAPRVALRVLEPLGQSQSHGRARLRGPVDLGLASPAGLHPAALHRLRPRQRLDRYQRRRCSTTSTPTPSR
jgi:hypothetical protein